MKLCEIGWGDKHETDYNEFLIDLFSFIVLTGLTVTGLVMEVVKGTPAASVIVFPHTPAKRKRGKTQVCFDAEPIHYKKCYPQHSISKPIGYGIGLFLFPLFFGRLRHSR